MATQYAPTIAARIIDYISQNPIDGLTIRGHSNEPRTDLIGPSGRAGDNAANGVHAPEVGFRDAASLLFNIAQLSLDAEKGPVRWRLEARSVDERTGIEAFRLVAGGELVRDITPVIDALRVVISVDRGRAE
ncbi:hypothetical protein [Nocardia carnea]|uniref:hypothetical protein n=1 Tax=Nocardia carnea TaxID=37328 RepID=UPI0024546B26|nr:hypothetical protein [Nocardia carnea]